MRKLPILLYLLVLALTLVSPMASASDTLWDMQRLSKPPKATWGEQKGLLQEVYYQSEPWRGKPTRVFAYYAQPNGPGPFPAMVLLHGGGGRAYSEWALHWAERGYAAIAMDLTGHFPTGQLEDGGPDPNDSTFRPFTDAEAREMWTYHAVADAILAYSLLASLPQIDKNRIGLTGISWGGYLACIVAGIDHRFKAAVPVYGCGFLQENSQWKTSVLDKMPEELRQRWVRFFDPSNYLPGVRCPILFLNGTNDHAYPLDSYKKSYVLVLSPRMLSVQLRLPHGHIWTHGVVDAFIDSQLKGGEPLPRLSPMTVEVRSARAVILFGPLPTRAELYYTADSGPWEKRMWEVAPATIHGRRVSAELPKGCTAFYLAVTDPRGNIITTQHELGTKGY